MKWQAEFAINIPAIDSQHKRLFELVTELNEALKAGLKVSHIEKLLSGLDLYKTRHFKLEEKYMKECNYPGLGAQQQAHQEFENRFSELSQEWQQKGITPEFVQNIKGELASWLKQHVTGLDREFGNYYKVYSTKNSEKIS